MVKSLFLTEKSIKKVGYFLMPRQIPQVDNYKIKNIWNTKFSEYFCGILASKQLIVGSFSICMTVPLTHEIFAHSFLIN